jgi:hypothetical protein
MEALRNWANSSMMGVSVSLESVSMDPKFLGVKLSYEGELGGEGNSYCPGSGSSVQTIEIEGGVKCSPVPKDRDPLEELSAENADLLFRTPET